MKKKNRMIITLLAIILAFTGCGNAVNIGDSEEQKENAEETSKAAEDLSEDIQQQSAVTDLPKEGEIPEDITSLSEDAASDEKSIEIAASDKESIYPAASHEESKDTDRANLSKEVASGMKEDVTNENTGLETNSDIQPIYEITNGNTGKRITLSDSQQLEYMDTLLEDMTIQKEESIQSDAEKTVGYLYCIRVLNENGDVSKTITLNGNHVEIDGKYYIVESTENLVAYLDDLYKLYKWLYK